MCVAIAQSKGAKSLTIHELEEGWASNPDGGGYAYIDRNNKIRQVHTMDRDEFILSYLDDHEVYGATSPFMVHMRIATHGEVSVENTHPFNVPLAGSGEMAFMHNGIITELTGYTGKKTTDTQALANEVLIDLDDRWLDNPHLVDYIENFIGYSKLVFLTTSPALDAEIYILNEDLGVWNDATWHSNYSCFDYVKADDPNVYNYKSWADDVHDMQGKMRYVAEDIVNATWDERNEMMLESIEKGDACTICMGIDYCYCDDVCSVCHEVWQECACLSFKSLTDAGREQYISGTYNERMF